MSTLKVQTIQHTNGTSGMTIDSGGRVNMPKIPCCFVQLTTSNAQDTSNPYSTTDTDIRFDSIILNQGSCYSESTGRFTVPVAGVYEAKANCLSDNSITNDSHINIRKNGTIISRGYQSVDSQYVAVVAHCLISCSVNDYFTVQLQNGAVYIDSNGKYSMFSVRLVG